MPIFMMQAMTQLGAKVTAYRESSGMSPPDYLIDQLVDWQQGDLEKGLSDVGIK
ncbi:MAG: hypothetical protein PHF37_08200 [Phycisphaerae bacterium]|nr:hypothetical protein [Phycisphaerae bacterium]